MKITPRNDYVLVQLLAEKEKTEGGILLPENTKNKGVFKMARILGIGALVNAIKDVVPPGERERDRNLLKVGMVVVINTMAAASVDPTDETLKIIHEGDVVANVE